MKQLYRSLPLLSSLLLASQWGAAQVTDPTFGTNGRVYTTFTSPTACDLGTDVVLLADGRLVTAGHGLAGIELARYTSTGALDPTFGTGGKFISRQVNDNLVSQCSNRRNEHPTALYLLQQPDGKLVTAGAVTDTTSNSLDAWTVNRFLPNGAVDPSFTPYSRCGYTVGGAAYRVLRQSTGRLVVVGARYGLSLRETILEGLTTGGTADSSFPSTTLGGGFVATDGWVDGLDRIWLVGTSQYISPTTSLYSYRLLTLYRLLPTGTVDSSFGTNGLITLSVNNNLTTGSCLVVLASGQVVVGGTTQVGNSYLPFLARYTTAGQPDTSFGTGGVAMQTLEPVRLVEQPDGKLLWAGGSFKLARALANGQLDPSYGTNGVASAQDGYECSFSSLVLQPDGKAVAVGTLYPTAFTVSFRPSSQAIVRFVAAPAALATAPVLSSASLQVYPNPSRGADWQLAAEGLTLPPTEAARLRVLTSLGQPVYEATVSGGTDQLRQLRIPAGQLAAGRYLVQLQTPAGALYRQVEVQ